MKSKSLISKLLAFFCCTALLLTSYSVYCAQDKTTVYVAGNANMYPLEYYDASSKQYLGLMPELYGLISEKTGYDFVYINAGKLNAQERMAKNCQADIISVYSEGDIDEKYIKSVHTVLVMQVDGEEKRVNIAFSDVASDKLISDISGALSEIPQDKMLSLLASHASENENDSYYKIWIYILSAVIIAFLIAAGAVIVYVLKKKKLNKKNTMIDEHYGIGNDKYYIYCFNNLISDKSRALYYIAYIAFDNEGFARKYGSAEVKSVQRYVSEFLSNKAGAVEYLSIISDGVFAFVYQSSNREDAKNRISDIIEALNTYLKNIKTEYTKLFAAGVCVLEDNMDCTAESAFYHAKQVYIYAVKNKTPFEFGTKNIVEQAKRNESLQHQIVQAISGGEFMIYLQYIVDRKGKITGAEAVSRWQNLREGLLTPSNYIDMINQSDTISLHDFYIFSLVCRKLEEWKHSGKDDLFISCNFTRYTITSSDFSDKIYEIAEKYDFNYNRLIIEVADLYMSGIGDQVSKNFETTIEQYFGQMESLVEVVAPEDETAQDMYRELVYRAKVRDFDYLAFCSEDGQFECLSDKEFAPRRPAPFIEALNKGERRVVIGLDTDGNEVVIFGVNASYSMKNGEKSTGLVGAVPLEYITNSLSLESDETLLYCHILREDGTFVVNGSDITAPDYFTSIRNQYTDGETKAAELYLEELSEALSENARYSSLTEINGDKRQIYEIPMPYSEWYLLMVMPYEALDDILNGVNTQWSVAVVLICVVIIALLMYIFYQYYRMTKKQLYELERVRNEALIATQAKSEFLSNMSHDIRTPMNAIVGMTSIALNNAGDSDTVQNCLRKISMSSKHLLGLINDVLDLSKIESGKMTLSYANVSLREVVEGIVGIVQPQVRAKKQSFDVKIENIKTEEIICDGVRLNQVLLNLLSNAVKYTPDEGSIELSISEVDSPKGDEYVQIHIYVKDNGIGMSSEFVKKLYESYTRADNERVYKTEGAGLGMSIVKYIVDAMDGKIDVKSELDKGTEFHITFDVKKAPVSEADMTLPAWNVLVVDDDADLCRTAVNTLASIGVNAEWALSGERALQMLSENHQYHIVILDWKLPGINGIQTARKIRSSFGNDLPILLISAYDWSEFESEAVHAGINSFVAKPLFKSTLYYALKQHMNVQESTVETESNSSGLDGCRILLAEDNELNWEVAREILSDLNLELDWAENGQICVEKFENSEEGYYDAVLMDLRMPVMNGYDATKAIRALNRPDAAKIPIIAMTADAFTEDIKRCLETGMNAHTAKPININELARLLKKYIFENR